MLLSRRQVTIEQKQSVGDSMQHLDLHFYCELWFAECRVIHYAGLIQSWPIPGLTTSAMLGVVSVACDS